MYSNWLSFSTELQKFLYQKYLAYVDNWKKGKKGSSYFQEWTDEDDAALFAALNKWTDEDDAALPAPHGKELKAKAKAGG